MITVYTAAIQWQRPWQLSKHWFCCFLLASWMQLLLVSSSSANHNCKINKNWRSVDCVVYLLARHTQSVTVWHSNWPFSTVREVNHVIITGAKLGTCPIGTGILYSNLCLEIFETETFSHLPIKFTHRRNEPKVTSNFRKLLASFPFTATFIHFLNFITFQINVNCSVYYYISD